MELEKWNAFAYRFHRQKGIGKIIMDALEAHAKEESLPKLKLHAQTHAEVFYKKLGYADGF